MKKELFSWSVTQLIVKEELLKTEKLKNRRTEELKNRGTEKPKNCKKRVIQLTSYSVDS